MFQELLTLVDCEVAIGAIIARALQQGDVTKRAVDDIRRLYKGCSQQHLAYLLKRQGVEASVDFARGNALTYLRQAATDPQRVFETVQALQHLQEAASALRQHIQPLPERSCVAAAAAAAGGASGGVGAPVEHLNYRAVKRVKREPGSPCLSPIVHKRSRPPTPGDETGVDSGDESDVVLEDEVTAKEDEEPDFLAGLLSPENPPDF